MSGGGPARPGPSRPSSISSCLRSGTCFAPTRWPAGSVSSSRFSFSLVTTLSSWTSQAELACVASLAAKRVASPGILVESFRITWARVRVIHSSGDFAVFLLTSALSFAGLSRARLFCAFTSCCVFLQMLELCALSGL